MENLHSQIFSTRNYPNNFERLHTFEQDSNYEDSLYDTNPIKNIISDKGKTQLVKTKFTFVVKMILVQSLSLISKKVIV